MLPAPGVGDKGVWRRLKHLSSYPVQRLTRDAELAVSLLKAKSMCKNLDFQNIDEVVIIRFARGFPRSPLVMSSKSILLAPTSLLSFTVIYPIAPGRLYFHVYVPQAPQISPCLKMNS